MGPGSGSNNSGTPNGNNAGRQVWNGLLAAQLLQQQAQQQQQSQNQAVSSAAGQAQLEYAAAAAFGVSSSAPTANVQVKQPNSTAASLKGSTWNSNYASVISGNSASSSGAAATANQGFNKEDFPALPAFRGSNLGVDAKSFNQNTGSMDSSFKSALLTNSGRSNQTISAANPSLSSIIQNTSAAARKNNISNMMQSSNNTDDSGVNNSSLKGGPIGLGSASGGDQFGLLGLLGVIRMSDQDLNTLSLGSDLSTLGLNLNSNEPLANSLQSPWASSKNSLEYLLPSCYNNIQSAPSISGKLPAFSDETLFYLFYSMPRDAMQEASAAQLFSRGWKFHKELKLWFIKENSNNANTNANTNANNNATSTTYLFFDVSRWEKVKKESVSFSPDQYLTSTLSGSNAISLLEETNNNNSNSNNSNNVKFSSTNNNNNNGETSGIGSNTSTPPPPSSSSSLIQQQRVKADR